MPENASRLAAALRPGASEAFVAILREHRVVDHEPYLVAALKRPSPAKELFAYGFAHLPPETRLPDDALGSFFYVLSELLDIVDQARDLALDAAAYCKSAGDVPLLTMRILRGRYKEIGRLIG